MSKSFYTNVALYKDKIFLRGVDSGKSFKKVIPYRPYLFIPSKNKTQYRTLDDRPVDKIDFENLYEARNFIKKYEDVEGFNIYGMDKFIYTFIHDEYPGTIDYDVSKIKVCAIDIEVDTQDGYPNIELADKAITAITLGYKDKRIVFGLKDYKTTNPNVKYFKCADEVILLKSFLNVWANEQFTPDVVTGWNIAWFDIPYIVIRIIRLIGEDYAKRLSPWLKLHEKEMFLRGKNVKTYIPVGIAVLDYMDLYKKFTQNQRDSYSLNNICHIELGIKKLDYSEYSGLAELYEKDHQKFIDYNIRDVDLIFMLEDRLKFIELVYAIAYDAKINFTDAFTSVLLWDVIIYNYLMDRNIVIPQFKFKEGRKLPGGYVKEPLVGMHDWVVSFDLTSLYPHLIIQNNISTETFIKKLSRTMNEHTIGDCYNIISEMTNKLKETQSTCTANGCLYTKEFQGFLPALMELQFKLRTEYKDKMKQAKKQQELIKNELSKRKIKLNTT